MEQKQEFINGQIVELEISDMTNQGKGIGKVGGFAIFVDKAIIGDLVIAQITKKKKSYAFAKLIEIKKESIYRQPSFCKYAKDCGGCVYDEITYEGQLLLKEKQVIDKLSRLGGLHKPKVRPIMPTRVFLSNDIETPLHYRNKATMQISTGGNQFKKGGIIENLGPVSIGFFRGASHEVIDCEECMIQNPIAMTVASVVRQFMKEDNISAYHEKWDLGLMKQVIVRSAKSTGEVMVVLVINGKKIPNGEKLVKMLDSAIYQKGYSLESVILDDGKETIPLAGRAVISDSIGDMKVEVSAKSFYQINPYMTTELYRVVREYAALTGREKILDLYCGVGTIGLSCAEYADYVLGIEVEKQAVLDANRNATINGIVNARYICGKAEEELAKLMRGEGDADLVNIARNSDVVILNPPRAGCHEALIDTVARVNPQRIVYMSCDPGTLARDIKILEQKGFKFVEATPADNFPGSIHVESVVLLSAT